MYTVYLYIYMYTYIYIYIYICICIFVCIYLWHTHIHTHIHACMHACMHACIHIHIVYIVITLLYTHITFVPAQDPQTPSDCRCLRWRTWSCGRSCSGCIVANNDPRTGGWVGVSSGKSTFFYGTSRFLMGRLTIHVVNCSILTLDRSSIFHATTHDSDWAIFKGKLWNYQRVDEFRGVQICNIIERYISKNLDRWIHALIGLRKQSLYWYSESW